MVSNATTLGIAVQVLERDPLNVQGRKRFLLVPPGIGWSLIFGPFRLTQHKPVILEGEMGIGELFLLLDAVVFLNFLRALTGDWHPQSQRLFTFLHVPAKFFPSPVGGQSRWLKTSLNALVQS